MAFPGVSRDSVARSSGILFHNGLPLGKGDCLSDDKVGDNDGDNDEGSDVDDVYGVDEDFG
jgi:hypothetical protein